jgi:hypothetical protein
MGSASPFVLTLSNSGREVHEFDSPVLMDAENRSSAVSMKETGIVLEPEKSAQLIMVSPAWNVPLPLPSKVLWKHDGDFDRRVAAVVTRYKRQLIQCVA